VCSRMRNIKAYVGISPLLPWIPSSEPEEMVVLAYHPELRAGRAVVRDISIGTSPNSSPKRLRRRVLAWVAGPAVQFKMPLVAEMLSAQPALPLFPGASDISR
jgi:hypothetical protein